MTDEGDDIRVIKAGTGAGAPLVDLVRLPEVRVVTGEALEMIESVDRRITEAVAVAEERLEAAGAQADRIREAARDEGRRDGLSEWMETVATLRDERSRLEAEARDDMLKLAFRVASQIIERTVDLHPAVVEGMVERSLAHVRGESDIEVRVHPDDRPVLEEARPRLESELGGARIQISDDETVDRGGCILETAMNRVDARVSVQLDSLRAALGSARRMTPTSGGSDE
jgi:flagellar biosynthesis/type III secretory pathway protein FliH